MSTDIAIVGMSCRLPGAENVDQFWLNLRSGTETISRFQMEDLRQTGISSDLLDDPRYVPAKGIVAGAENFDAEFFGMSPREAALTDPQHRVLLECAWATLEAAAYDPDDFPGRIGIYAGCGIPTYLFTNVLPHLQQTNKAAGGLPLLIATDKDHLTSRIAYRLNMKGPAITVQTACSTSLVAIHLACQGLLAGDCEMALAGGANITTPLRAGYLYEEGGIVSPDGHCRPFDAEAMGTVFGDGVGLVLLKRLDAAIRDRDHIHAVILGSAIDNDGHRKIGYTAPSIQGEQDAIQEALKRAAELNGCYDVDYVETHGTATPLGDPIEVAALSSICEQFSSPGHRCAIGSVKSNIGHLDAAAGIAGLIKTILAIEHGELPPTLHYSTLNPQIQFGRSGLYVNNARLDWPIQNRPRRAAVSSFGIGGTNAHVILQEAPKHPNLPINEKRPWPVTLSARSEAALNRQCELLIQHLTDHPALALSDVSYTLLTGRRGFRYRMFFVADTLTESITALNSGLHRQKGSPIQELQPHVVFLFAGDGERCLNAGRQLYERVHRFRELIDQCSDLLPHDGRCTLSQILYPAKEFQNHAGLLLNDPQFAGPALFAIEYAIARLWLELGIQPEVMFGHGVGEYTAACLAGVFTLEEVLSLLMIRGQLFQESPPGQMIAAQIDEGTAQWYLEQDISLAVEHSSSECTFSGASEAMELLRSRLGDDGIPFRILPGRYALQSTLMESTSKRYSEIFHNVSLKSPTLPFISSVTGKYITADEATSREYWVNQLKTTIRFRGAVELLARRNPVFIEAGPGRRTSSQVSGAADAFFSEVPYLTTMAVAEDSDFVQVLESVGQLWSAGRSINWNVLLPDGNRIPLPTYPFERKYHWIESENIAEPVVEPELSRVPERQDTLQTGLHREDFSTEQVISRLRNLTQEMLGIPAEETTSTANLAELGIDSLLIIRIVQMLHDEFGIKISAAFLLDGDTTLEVLANHIAESMLRSSK